MICQNQRVTFPIESKVQAGMSFWWGKFHVRLTHVNVSCPSLGQVGVEALARFEEHEVDFARCDPGLDGMYYECKRADQIEFEQFEYAAVTASRRAEAGPGESSPATDLSTATREELVEELKRRHKTVLVLTTNPAKVGEDQQQQVDWKGGPIDVMGSLEWARWRVRRYYLKIERERGN